MLGAAREGATFLLNAPQAPDEVWDALPRPVQKRIIDRKLRFFVIDATKVAQELGLGPRVNTILQTCFFAISGVLPRDEAIAAIKHAIEKAYGRKGGAVVEKNFAAVDAALAHLHEVTVPGRLTGAEMPPLVPADAPAFVRKVTAMMMAGRGDEIPVSAMPIDGSFPPGTTAYEKRNIAVEVPRWDADLCIQCGQCSIVCPHSVIRAKYYPEEALADAPEGFPSAEVNARGFPGSRFTLQIHVEDCTGCGICVENCPAISPTEPGHKAIDMVDKQTLIDAREAQPRLLRDAAAARPLAGQLRQCARRPVPRAAVRVLRRLRRLRRDALRQAHQPALRRPAADRQRHRLLVDLWRQPAGPSVEDRRRRARTDLGQLAVRGQRRVRPRLPAGDRPADGDGAAAAGEARAAGRRGSRQGHPRRAGRSPRANSWRSANASPRSARSSKAAPTTTR